MTTTTALTWRISWLAVKRIKTVLISPRADSSSTQRRYLRLRVQKTLRPSRSSMPTSLWTRFRWEDCFQVPSVWSILGAENSSWCFYMGILENVERKFHSGLLNFHEENMQKEKFVVLYWSLHYGRVFFRLCLRLPLRAQFLRFSHREGRSPLHTAADFFVLFFSWTRMSMRVETGAVKDSSKKRVVCSL